MDFELTRNSDCPYSDKRDPPVTITGNEVPNEAVDEEAYEGFGPF